MTQIIAQRYRILEELGQGGMGTVYRGLDSRTQQTVAIKQLKPELTTPELVERFVREGTALRELNHPNIVKMLDSVQEDGNHYLIIEYLSGGDLSNLLKAGQLPIEKVLQLAIDICDALTRAHRLDIIHRDLKPANVLLAEDGTPRLTDFGIARIGKKERVTATDAIVGTVDYLAPEVLDGSEIDARADIWAFGVMLFEVLAGERPFKGVSVAQTLMAIVTQPVPDLEALRPDAPVSLVDLIYRMLEKSRDARIRSVRQVGLELEDMLHGRTQQTPPETRFAPETPNLLLRPKHNLPAQTTPFVGREAELVELAKLLNDTKIRLITILASGGMGKTRLALEAAEQSLTPPQPLPEASRRGFENGVYFVELAPLSDPANIVSAIAEATGYQFQSDGREPKQQILDFLAHKNLLLVLDNFEHLLEGAPLVTDILKAAPQVKVLATSRQRLNQSGETLFNLEGMDFPAWETPADALEYAAVKLFMQSAKRAKPDFDITPDNMDAIARICKLVQGMPLGIVLAAAWLSMLSPDEIAVEIVKGIDFLESELSDLPERHQSIRAVFDYSWNLLTDDEKQVFMKLSVFRGGFTREAVEAVTGANLRLLMSLMSKSLIRRDADSGRYEIHELLRQYASEQLSNQRQLALVRDIHSRYFLAEMLRLKNDLRAINQMNSIREARIEFENITFAWEWAIEQGWFEELSNSADFFWLAHFRIGRSDACFKLMDKVVTTAELNTDIQELTKVRLKIRWSAVAFESSKAQIIEENLKHSITVVQQHSATFDEWLATHQLGRCLLTFRRDYKLAHQTFLDAYNIAALIKDLSAMSISAFFAGITARMTDAVDGVNMALKSYDLAKTVNDLFQQANSAQLLAFYSTAEDEHEQARNYALESLNIAKRLQSYDYPYHLSMAGLHEVYWGNFDAAIQYLNESLEQDRFLESGSTSRRVNMNFGLALIAYYRGNFDNALQLMREALEGVNLRSEVEFAHEIQLYSVQILHWMGEFDDARTILRTVLSDFKYNRREMLLFLIAMQPLLFHLQKYEQVCAYQSLILNYPKQYPITYRDPHLLSLKAQTQEKLGEQLFNTLMERGRLLDLETVTRELVAEFMEDA